MYQIIVYNMIRVQWSIVGKVLFFIDLILIFLFRNAGVLDVEIFVGTDAGVSKFLIG